MRSVTYGTLPTREEFESAFLVRQEGRGFFVDLNPKDADLFAFVGLTVPTSRAEWSLDDTWRVIKTLTEAWESGDVYVSDEAGFWASSLLSMFGWEWV